MTTSTLLSLNTFGKGSFDDQAKKGDMLRPGFIPDVTAKIKVDVTDFDVTQIRKLRNELSSEEELQFVNSYGNLLTVMDVRTDWGCIRAALRFWDPYYRCFSFDGGVDLTPTLEEYSTMMNFTAPISAIYQNVRLDSSSVKIRLDNWLGITTRVREGNYIWCWSDIEKHFYLSTGRKRLRTLAFAIIGLILFPKMKDAIDFEAANVFFEMESNSINPTTAILAETFRSLDLCRRKGKGKLTCCTQLLTVWIISHFKQTPEQNLLSAFCVGANPLLKVINAIVTARWKMESKEVWVDRFIQLSEEDFDWHAKWLRAVNPIVCCGPLLWVPLIGARGCVHYCPALVLRQFNIMQIVPATFGMSASSMPHIQEDQSRQQYAGDWARSYSIEGHVRPTPPMLEYPEWRSNRANGNVLPRPENQKPAEEEGESHVSRGAEVMTHNRLFEQARQAREERDDAKSERDAAVAKQRDLEFQVRELERRNNENIRIHIANQKLASDDFTERLSGEIRKREASSAIIKDKDVMIKTLISHGNKKSKALQARVMTLEANLEARKGEIASLENFWSQD